MAYRFEYALTNRGMCKDSTCKADGIKIGKGELKAGSYYVIKGPNGEFSGWNWKHWGCFTPKQLLNFKDVVNEDPDLIDNYENLKAEDQEKIMRAMAQGHVDDEDWRHDVVYNRLGAPMKRTPKKKTTDEDDAEDGPESPTKKPTKKRGKSKTDDGDDEPAPKRKRKTAKAQADHDLPDEDQTERPQPKKKRKSARDAAKVQDEEPAAANAAEAHPTMNGDAEPATADKPAPAAKRGRKVANKEVHEDLAETAISGTEAAEETKSAAAPNRGRKSAKKEVEDDVADEALPAPRKRGRKAAVKSEPDNNEEDVEEAPKTKRAPTKSKGCKQVKHEAVGEEDKTTLVKDEQLSEVEEEQPAPPRRGRPRKVKA